MTPDPVWLAKPCQQSGYSQKIVTCEDESCCSAFQTNWLKTFPDRFIPFLSIYEYTNNGIIPIESARYFKNLTCPRKFAPITHRLLVQAVPEEAFKFKIIPFDLYCPFVKEKLNNGICTESGKYWSSEASMKRHRKALKKGQNLHVEYQAESDGNENDKIDEQENQERTGTNEENMPVIDNILDLFKSPFIEENSLTKTVKFISYE